MGVYVAQRVVAAVPTLTGVALVVFALVRLLPGDPALLMAGPLATEDDVERIRAQLGLEAPAPVQLAAFFGRLVSLDLGRSSRSGQPVLAEIAARLPNTIELAVASMLIATAVGVAAGVLAAARHGSAVDHLVSAATLFGISMPVYWLGLMLIVLFAVQLQVLPAAGKDDLASFVLPSLALGSVSVGLIARMTRSSMLEVLRAEHVRTARAKGLAEDVVLWRHALPSALLPILTVVGFQFGSLLGGAVLTESVFGWPGMGLLLVDSIFSRDYATVQGVVLVFAALFIAVNLVVDVLYAVADPRIRLR